MNSREIVQRTLAFERPERVARSFAPSDFVWASPEIPNPQGEWRRVSEREWRRMDEWGNEWGRLESFSKGEVVRGALDDLARVGTLPLPDFSNPSYYANASAAFAAEPERWHIGSIHGLTFSIARKLRKMEQYLVDLMLDRDPIRVLHDRVDEQIRLQILRMAEAGADCVMIAEDWGTQTQLLIRPSLWREEFKPRFSALCAYAHSLGLKFFMHSCGQMGAIVPDLIEAGVDVLQFDQPRVHGLDKLERWRDQGRVTLWCPVDIQATLQTRNVAVIQREAREMIERLWRGEGGFIAGFYTDEPSIGLEPQWQQAACEVFLQAGRRDRLGLPVAP
ncbi:MAG: hypothetical protein M1546_24110 [Chloroflexi bacterium]|nr:hypothetical protein [Chloroflexota bacterium]